MFLLSRAPQRIQESEEIMGGEKEIERLDINIGDTHFNDNEALFDLILENREKINEIIDRINKGDGR
jgi:hypothetical protein